MPTVCPCSKPPLSSSSLESAPPISGMNSTAVILLILAIVFMLALMYLFCWWYCTHRRCCGPLNKEKKATKVRGSGPAYTRADSFKPEKEAPYTASIVNNNNNTATMKAPASIYKTSTMAIDSGKSGKYMASAPAGDSGSKSGILTGSMLGLRQPSISLMESKYAMKEVASRQNAAPPSPPPSASDKKFSSSTLMYNTTAGNSANASSSANIVKNISSSNISNSASVVTTTKERNYHPFIGFDRRASSSYGMDYSNRTNPSYAVNSSVTTTTAERKPSLLSERSEPTWFSEKRSVSPRPASPFDASSRMSSNSEFSKYTTIRSSTSNLNAASAVDTAANASTLSSSNNNYNSNSDSTNIINAANLNSTNSNYNARSNSSNITNSTNITSTTYGNNANSINNVTTIRRIDLSGVGGGSDDSGEQTVTIKVKADEADKVSSILSDAVRSGRLSTAEAVTEEKAVDVKKMMEKYEQGQSVDASSGTGVSGSAIVRDMISGGSAIVSGVSSMTSGGSGLVSGRGGMVSGGSGITSGGSGLVSGNSNMISGGSAMTSGGSTMTSGGSALVGGSSVTVSGDAVTSMVLNPGSELKSVGLITSERLASMIPSITTTTIEDGNVQDVLQQVVSSFEEAAPGYTVHKTVVTSSKEAAQVVQTTMTSRESSSSFKENETEQV